MKTLPDNNVDAIVSHSDLVTRGAKWLRSTVGCCAVLEEMVSEAYNREIPDIIGWTSERSVLVECKVSRADFLADSKKPFRDPTYRDIEGMGNWRFFLTPVGLLTGDDCPEGWGIYEVSGGRVFHLAGRKYGDGSAPFRPCLTSERTLLVSALRRSQANAKGEAPVR